MATGGRGGGVLCLPRGLSNQRHFRQWYVASFKLFMGVICSDDELYFLL